MTTYRVTVPFVPDMGSIQPYNARAGYLQTYRQDALWTLNRMRDHDGLPHLTRMPAGTKYQRTGVQP